MLTVFQIVKMTDAKVDIRCAKCIWVWAGKVVILCEDCRD
jgi:hypothetical protein